MLNARSCQSLATAEVILSDEGICDIPGELTNEPNVRMHAKVLLYGVLDLLAVQEKKPKSSCCYLPRLVVIRKESKTSRMPQFTWKSLGKRIFEFLEAAHQQTGWVPVVVAGCEIDDGGGTAYSSLTCAAVWHRPPDRPPVYKCGHQDDAKMSDAGAGYAARGDIADVKVCC